MVDAAFSGGKDGPALLPRPRTSFVGRESELARAKQLLDQNRLLTLTGPGGCGKTRLSIALATRAADDFPTGIYFVPLAAIRDASLVPVSIAQSVGLQDARGGPLLEHLSGYMGDRKLLLVLDNFEQVASGAEVLEQLLTAAPRVKALVTSRVVLSLRGEHVYPVPPLQPPGVDQKLDPVDLERFDAVRLFTERAVAVQPKFRLTAKNAQAVAEITARLDGLPLAIELAAARIKILAPAQILPKLDRRLTLLTSGSRTLPERQRTLRGAISWSYDLLADAEQRLFTRLSVFSGGWSLPAAEGIAQPEELELDVLDGLSSLVDESLIRIEEPNGHPRFSMLETIREFAQEELSGTGELESLRRRHGEYFLGLAIQAEAHLTGGDQAEWLSMLEREHGNLRKALRWAVDTGQASLAQEAAGALWRFWHQHGYLAEGRKWFNEILDMPDGQKPTPARGKALTGAGGIAWWQVDHPAARDFYDEALAVAREVGNPSTIAGALYDDAFAVGAAGDLETSHRMLEESLALYRRIEDEQGVARALVVLVLPDAQAGRWDQVIARLEEAVSIWRRIGERLQLAFDLIWLAFACSRAGRRHAAHRAAVEALSIFRETDNAVGIALAFRDLAFLALMEERPREALGFAAVAESLRQKTGGGPPAGFGGMLEGDPANEARSKLTDVEADSIWEEGRSMDLELALAQARRFTAD